MINIHPVFVHFPIALFLLYGGLELLRFTPLKNKEAYFYVKAVLVILGSISAWITLQTWELAEEAFQNSAAEQLVETHSAFATASTIIFSIIAAAYLISWIEKEQWLHLQEGSTLQKIWNVLKKIEWLLIETPLVYVIVLAGILCITITGALGGTIVYGPDIDPLANFVYHLFF